MKAAGLFGDVNNAELAMLLLAEVFNGKGFFIRLHNWPEATGIQFFPLPHRLLPSLSPKHVFQLPFVQASQEAWIAHRYPVIIPGISNIDCLFNFNVNGKETYYTLRQILRTVWQEEDNERPLFK